MTVRELFILSIFWTIDKMIVGQVDLDSFFIVILILMNFLMIMLPLLISCSLCGPVLRVYVQHKGNTIACWIMSLFLITLCMFVSFTNINLFTWGMVMLLTYLAPFCEIDIAKFCYVNHAKNLILPWHPFVVHYYDACSLIRYANWKWLML